MGAIDSDGMADNSLPVRIDLGTLLLPLLGCYGQEGLQTPHFDRLASKLTVFDQHFSNSLHYLHASRSRHKHCWLYLDC